MIKKKIEIELKNDRDLKIVQRAVNQMLNLYYSFDDSRNVDIIELLEYLSLEKKPTIKGSTLMVSDNESLGGTWICGSKKAIAQKWRIDKAATEIIDIVRKYREVEELGEEYFIDTYKKELDETLRLYDGIDTNIYFLYDKASKAIKVGRSVNVQKRLKKLQTGSPNEITLLYKCEARLSWENLIKKELEQYRIRNEWFRACDETFKFILWLKFVQETKLNPDNVNRNMYDDKYKFEEAMKELLEKV